MLAVHQFKGWEDVAPLDWSAAENPALGIHHAVILFDKHILDDSDQDGIGYYSHYARVRVLDEAGVNDCRTLTIPFSGETKVRRLEARTVKPDGREISVGGDDIFEKTVISFGKNRLRAKTFAFKEVDPGDILEYQYTIRGPHAIEPMLQLRHEFYTLQADVQWYYYPHLQIDRGEFTEDLLDRIDFAPAYVIPNGKRFGGHVEEFPDAKKPEGLTVHFNNLPPLPDEPYMTSERESAVLFAACYRYPRLEVKKPFWERVAKTWGSQTREFIGDASSLTDWMKDLVPLPRSCDQDLERCFDRIHREIRNSDFLEENELPPEMPEIYNLDDLMRERLGRSLEINYLLVAMLQKLGYKATVFWVRNQEDGPFMPELMSASQFTMSGVAVRDDANSVRYCFPALPVATPSTLPWEVCGCKAMLEDLTEEHEIGPFPALSEIPMAPQDGNSTSLRVVLRPEPDGELAGRLSATWERSNDPFFMQDLARTLARGRKGALARLKDQTLLTGLKWSAFEESLSVRGATASYSCSLRVDGVLQEAGGMQLCDLGAIRSDDYALPDGSRESNIDFKYPQHYTTQVDLVLPDGYDAGQLPAPAQMIDRIAEFQSRYSTEGGRLTLRRELRIPYSLYLASAADRFRQFFRDVRKADAEPTVLRPRSN